jgi:DNA-directed RNA polymerase specialized sigma24 family protein
LAFSRSSESLLPGARHLFRCHLCKPRNIPVSEKEVRVPDSKQNLLQLYRFCFLMLADARKAQEIFHATLRAAAQQSADDEPPTNRLWFFREARSRCLEASEQGLQAEDVDLEREEIAPGASAHVARLEPMQLAIWISAAPDPQRTALALFYLDEFDHAELLDVIELKPAEVAKLLSNGRHEFQAWLNATLPLPET